MLKNVFGGLLIVHGAIHAMGVAWAWDLADIEGLGGPTLIFGEGTPGDPAITALGWLWLIAMIGFIAAGIGISRRSSLWMPVVGVAATVSLIVTIIWWSEARIGSIVSAVALVAATVYNRLQNDPEPEPHPTAELFVPQWWRTTL